MKPKSLLAAALAAACGAALGTGGVLRGSAAAGTQGLGVAAAPGLQDAGAPTVGARGNQDVYVPRAEVLPGPEIAQPVAFSHRTHAEKAGLDCLACHAGATSGDTATLPRADTCLTCHAALVPDHPEVAKLRAAPDGRIAWARVYALPHYVFFSHREHVTRGVDCAECHGPVAARDALRKEVSTGMNACLACHRRTQAPVDCAACHTLGH